MKAKVYVGIGLLLLIGGYFLFKNPLDIFANSSISGKIGLNGTAPSGSIISLFARKVGASDFEIVLPGISPSDGATWEWKGAKPGTHYQIQASLDANGVLIAQSDIVGVAAPASDEELHINLPSIPTNTVSSISGTIDVNGVIPAGSTVNVVSRKQGETSFSTVAGGIPAADGASWIWNNAQSGATYEMKAYVVVNNKNYAESKRMLTVNSPAGGEVFIFNFPAATAVTPTGVPSSNGLSGKINLNGSIPSGASITIATRVNGQSQFNTVINSLSAQDQTVWSWSSAKSGTSYDIQANLQTGGNTIASSDILTVTSPASNEMLTINYGSGNLSVPPLSPGVYCIGQGGSNNNWSANISYHSVNGALVYWVQIYDTNNNSILSSQIPPNNQQLPTTYNFNTNNLFNTGSTYFVKYAYSTCATCTNTYSYSPFTPAAQFSCVVAPAPTNTPYPTQPTNPTYTPYPTNQPPPNPTATSVPTSVPTPSPTQAPRISKCNQSCGGNGYSCEAGLECLSSGIPGGSVCRNASCTDQMDCDCKN